MENSHARIVLNDRQFSLRFLLLAFPLVGLALAYPGWGYLALVILPFSLLAGALYVVVAAVYWIFADDRKHVAAFALQNIRGLLIMNLLFIAYLIYAYCCYGPISLG